MSALPDKPALEGLETKWDAEWERTGVFRFDRTGQTRASIYSIDTPPPTASSTSKAGTTSPAAEE